MSKRFSIFSAQLIDFGLNVIADNLPINRVNHNMSNKDGHKVVDLFAGVGGLSLGAVRAGFQVVLAIENDEHALAAHQKNFPNVEHLNADVFDLDGYQLLESCGLATDELDGIIGGPPCQGFSTIGRRCTLDPRNDLFVKFFEIVGQAFPKFYLAENVLGILSEQYNDIRQKAFNHVSNSYVLLPPLKLKASDYGAATSRERIFFIGYRKDILRSISPEDFDALKVDNKITVGVALAGLPRIRKDWQNEKQSWRTVQNQVDSNFTFWEHITGFIPEGIGNPEAIQRYIEDNVVSGCFGTRHSEEVRARFARLKPGERDPVSKSIRLDLGGYCPTIRAGTNSDKGSYQAVRPIHPTSPRVITPREAARLQGFPDWFQFSPTKWHSFRQIGNSVSPILAERLLVVIRNHLIDSSTKEDISS